MSRPDPSTLQPGTPLPTRAHTPDTTDLFFYNAALWNAHRIHYDLPYATTAEGYPGLVVPGPLMGDWLAQCVDDWLGDAGTIVRFEYSNRQAAYVGEVLTSGGTIESYDGSRGEAVVSLFVRNADGEIIVPGRATVRFRTVRP